MLKYKDPFNLFTDLLVTANQWDCTAEATYSDGNISQRGKKAFEKIHKLHFKPEKTNKNLAQP